MLRTSRALASAALACTLLSAGGAAANGRYPQAFQLAEDPSEPGRLWLRTTYGLLTSADRGANWGWICEEGLGFRSADIFDPMFGVHENGTVIIGLVDGLARTRNKGCDFALASDVPNLYVYDLAVDARVKSRALILSTQYDGTGTAASYKIELRETTNNAETFQVITHDLPKNGTPVTLDAAPSDPARVYMSMHMYDTGHFIDPVTFVPVLHVPALYRSNDRGKHWQRLGWSGLTTPLPAATELYIAAVHPTNPDVVYVRTRYLSSERTITSLLLYTSDGGASWKEIFRGSAPMMGFALSPDGTEAAVGLADPNNAELTVAPGALGLWRSPAPAFEFRKVFDKTISCLTWTARGLYACSDSREAGFDVGLMTNTCPAFQVIQRRDRIMGPLACPVGSKTRTECTAQRWSTLCSPINLNCPDGGAPFRDAGASACDDPIVPDAGSGGSGVGAGGGAAASGGAPGDGGRDAGASTGGTRNRDADGADGDCSCRVARPTHASLGAFAGAVLVLLQFGRRRTRWR
jgi:hypothetical protein